MNKEYLSVSEFARRINLSRQAVYRRLTTDLQEFVKIDNGVKVIDSAALQLFGIPNINSRLTEPDDELDSRITDDLQSVDNHKYEEYIDFLQKQLQKKDEQIEKLSDRLAEVTQTLSQQQQLQLQLQAQLLPPDQPKEEEKKSFWQRILNK